MRIVQKALLATTAALMFLGASASGADAGIAKARPLHNPTPQIEPLDNPIPRIEPFDNPILY